MDVLVRMGTPRSNWEGAVQPRGRHALLFRQRRQGLHRIGASGRPLVTATSRALTALAYSGDPNHDELPRWPSYDLKDRLTMRFDTPSSVENDPYGAERICWDGISLGGL